MTTARVWTIVIAAIDALAWLAVAFATFGSGSDPATKGLDRLAGIAATLLLLVTAVPALVLALRRRAPRLALALALAFPAAFVAMFAIALAALA